MDRRTVMRGAVAGGALLAGAGKTALAEAASTKTRQITVAVGHRLGPIRPLFGVAGVPGPLPDAPTDQPRFRDMHGAWTRGHVALVRSHDWQARLDTVDNPDSLFPRWSADPRDPASYNFARADVWVAQAQATGAEVLFTIASAIPHNKLPIADLDTYGTVIEHVVRHYVSGWGSKAAPQRPITHWEFGDQPDLGKLHFAGTPEQFYAMYAAFARAVKRVDPALKVGGPGLAFALNADIGFREAFLAHVQAASLPLDFYTYNWFSDVTRDAMDQAVVAKALRDVLDRAGFAHTQLVCDSWNYLGVPTNHAPPAEAAAYLAAAGIYLVDAPIDRALYFRGDGGWDPHYGFHDPDGFEDKDGHTDQRLPAVVALGRALHGERLAVQGGDDDGLAALATWDTAAGVLRVLVANHQRPAAYAAPRASNTYNFRIPLGPSRIDLHIDLPPQRPVRAGPTPQAISLALDGLPFADGALTVLRRLIDDHGTTTDTLTARARHGRLVLACPLAAPAVVLFELAADKGALDLGETL